MTRGGARLHASGAVEDVPEDSRPYGGRSAGLERRQLVGAGTGSIHQAVTACALAPAGRLERHAHAFEEGLYVLAGEVEVVLRGGPERLAADDYAFLGAGTAHELRNPGGGPARWLEVSSPQPGARGFADTGFAPRDGAEGVFRRGRFDPAQLPAPSGEILPGFGAANVVGASVKMLIDAELGASQFTLFVVEYRPGGAIEPHDHPFEEAYAFVSGEVEATLGGRPQTLRAGDWCWTGVGEPHSFRNVSAAPVRWIETQAPQPPARHQARFFGEWTATLAAAGEARERPPRRPVQPS